MRIQHDSTPRLPGQPEVCNLDTALVRHQQVGNLQVSVDDERGVEISEATEDLLHDTFHLGLREGGLHVVQE